MLKRGVALLLLLCMALPCAAAAAQADARRVVYLTFDDGPKKDTPELLDALEALDVPATFFLVGLGVRAFPEYARQIVQAGHAVGCHTMGHIWAMGTSEVALTAHLVMPDGHPQDAFFQNITHELHERFDIEHVTVQVVREPFTQSCAGS